MLLAPRMATKRQKRLIVVEEVDNELTEDERRIGERRSVVGT